MVQYGQVFLLTLLVFVVHSSAVKQSIDQQLKPSISNNKETVVKHPSIVEGQPNVIANEVAESSADNTDEVKQEESQTTTESAEQDEEVTTVTAVDNNSTTSNDEKVNYDGVQVIRVVVKSKEQKKCLKNLADSGDISFWMGNGTGTDIMVRANSKVKVYQVLDEKRIPYDMVIQDLQRAIDEENPHMSEDELSELQGRNVDDGYSHNPRTMMALVSPYAGDGASYFRQPQHSNYIDLTTTGKKTNFNKNKFRPKRGHRLTWQLYHRMNDIHGYLDYLAATYPQICSLETIGKSVEGKPLKVLKISSGNPNSPAIWVDSGIHAREWITPASSTYVISQIVEGGSGPQGVDWYFLPIVNPDGYEYSHQSDRLWRKNRANPQRGSCAGIDLNRNFGYRWGGQGASRQPCRETYAGAGPFSEPETSAINKFITGKQGQVRAYVSLHSYGQYILYPWGYDRKVPPDYADLDRVGRQMSQAMRDAGGPSYTVGAAAATLYPASGGSDDWAKGTAKVKYSYTIELRDTGRHGFVLPSQHIIPTGKDAHAALMVLAKNVQELKPEQNTKT